MSKYLFIGLASIVVLSVACSPGYHTRKSNGIYPPKSSHKVVAEAYRFDAQVRRDGKPTSFRLEIYRTDSVMAISGRGYLGRGVMKGRYDNDSLLVLFPVSAEYVHESAGSILQAGSCPEEMPIIDLPNLLACVPDSMGALDGLEVVSDYRKPKHPQFTVYAPGCQWNLELTYDLRKVGYRLRRFVYDNGQGTVVKGKRSKFKSTTRVPQHRFEVNIPPEAVRILL